MIEFKNLDIIIPFKVGNSEEVLFAILNGLKSKFKVNIHVLENASYKEINLFIKSLNSKIVCLHSCNYALQDFQYLLSYKLILDNLSEIVIPYNNLSIQVNLETFKNKYNSLNSAIKDDYSSLEGLNRSEYSFFGGLDQHKILFFNTETIKRIGLLNENIENLRYGESEIIIRAFKLEAKIVEVIGTAFYVINKEEDNKTFRYLKQLSNSIKLNNEKKVENAIIASGLLNKNKEEIKKEILNWNWVRKE
jgi:hypothetical protein